MILRRLLGLLLLLALAVPAAATPRKASLTLQWYPQTQFAGYYMALAKGFYQRRGIDLTLRRGGADVDGPRDLKEGRTQFVTLFLTGALAFRSPELPLVNVGQIVNRGNVLIVAKKKSRILKVEDLNGRRMSLWGDHFSGAYKQLFGARKVWPVVVPQFFSVELFLRGAVDACSAMSYNEYQRILQAGWRPEELTVISLRDQGCDFPEDGIYCLESTWKKDPGLCRDLLEASLEGWRYAAAHPDEAVALLEAEADKAGYTVNSLLLRRMLLTILPSVFPSGKDRWTPGRLSREDYERTVSMMAEVYLLPGDPVPYETFVPYARDPDWGGPASKEGAPHAP